MKLYNNDTEFEVSIFDRVTSKTKNLLLQEVNKFKANEKQDKKMELLAKINEENLKSKVDNLITGLSDKEQIVKDVDYKLLMELQKVQKDFDPEIEKHNDNVYINCIKCIISSKGLTDEQYKLVQSASNSEFWLDQDIQAIKAEVNGFCTKAAV